MSAPQRPNEIPGGDGAASHRDLLRAVIDNLPDSIFAKDLEGRFLMVNETVARIMGRASTDEVVGRADDELVESVRAEHYRQVDRRVLVDGEPLLDHEETRFDEDGQMRWDLTTKVPLRDADGRIYGLVAISREITAQKIAEQRLREALTELREAQAQLVEIENSRTVGRLAVGIAHEVQNPLAVALMGIEFLAQESFPAESAAPVVLEEMRTALQRADSIVREVLTFSEPAPLALAPQDVEELVDESLARLGGALTGLTVERERGPGSLAAPLDREKIGRVLDLIFQNAIVAMKGEGRLTVRTRAAQLTGVGPNVGSLRAETFRVGEIIVTVQIDDTGPGIPADKLGKVFEPFYSTAPTGQGTGLGLTVARAIMDLHGGAIRLRNRASGGLSVELMFKA